YSIPTRFSWLSTLMGLLMVGGFFCLFIGIVYMSAMGGDLTKIKEDYRYYQNMISYAETHYEYQVLGTITDYFYNENCDRYYITYEFSGYGYTVDGYSFSVYTRDEVFQMHIGDDIWLAVNSHPINQNTDSIPMDYKNMPLSKDGEYLVAIKSRNIGITLTSIGGTAIASVFVLFYVLYKISKKDAEKKSLQEKEKERKEIEKTHCPYCGLLIAEAQVECSGCGSKARAVKKTKSKKIS
ncbi:MAG: hypothetical protein J6J24_03920, partial [Clostridia bacterium]|nr:hypothetical protein [Clostridia bacterium]